SAFKVAVSSATATRSDLVASPRSYSSSRAGHDSVTATGSSPFMMHIAAVSPLPGRRFKAERTFSLARALGVLVAALAFMLCMPRAAKAAPEAHILRIDPRASQTDGSPILTTVLELVQNKRVSELTGACATLTGDANLDCVAGKLEQPGATFSSFEFPEKNAILTVAVDNTQI